MPHKTLDIGRDTTLYMAAVLILMGGAGLLTHWLGIVYPLRSVLLPDTPHDEQADMAQCLLRLVARPYRIDDHELYLSASIGIAMSHDAIDQPMKLIQQADMAMYRAKQQGRNAYQWFTREITRRVNERLAMRNKLQEAIDGKRFELHYQPLYDRRLRGSPAALESPGKGVCAAERVHPGGGGDRPGHADQPVDARASVSRHALPRLTGGRGPEGGGEPLSRAVPSHGVPEDVEPFAGQLEASLKAGRLSESDMP
ncbi:diguanylate cyclase domain-containing protein [Billgrantia endophytica]|uniref:GGDEF domain-containing protein n=1 Tax=Billgrantia endophytica TaxID=2033802 RepID=A0A2N7TXU0_9GAMM|nr:GGDEF domain-containing protein [Halomonas endophytica]PMR72989.1 hypothetical protein C1H69_19145 [Halomonas endophytica]